MKPFSLYIHIPFCAHKCPYCDFNTYAVSSAPEQTYTDALLAELNYRTSLPEWHGRNIRTIFFGGGTPSLFSAQSISALLEGARRNFDVDSDAEISLEANPGDVSLETLAGYRKAGINRISFGAQSFNSRVLRTLGRLHSPDQILSALDVSRRAGIENYNLDLIYGVPEQSVEDFQADLTAALSLRPKHISAYHLTIEEGTPFFSAWKRGVLICPPEARVVEMMELLATFLPANGLKHYEISNFAIPGWEARHNLAYWNGDDYIGLGAGAHSFNRAQGSGGVRWSNYAMVNQYTNAAMKHGNAESWREELNMQSAMFEFFFLGLRKIAGVSLAEFKECFGISFDQAYPELRSVLQIEDLAIFSERSLALTQKGLLLTNSVLEYFAKPNTGGKKGTGPMIGRPISQ